MASAIEEITQTQSIISNMGESIPAGFIAKGMDFQIVVDRLNLIRTKVQLMDSARHAEVLKIVRNTGGTYSENSNGVFINLSILNETALQEIEKFIKITEDQDKILNSIEIEKERLIHDHYKTDSN